MNVYIFDASDQQGEIEVTIMTTTAPDNTPVVAQRFRGSDVHKIFADAATMVLEERIKRARGW